MKWQDNFKEWKEIIVSTASLENNPNANIVISIWVHNWKILIANCQMTTTIKNLKSNNKVCLISWYIRVLWEVEILNSGELFDKACENAEADGVVCKEAILITVKEVFDLSEVKIIEKFNNK